MSAFAPNENEVLDAKHVATHMLPLFEYAAEIVPSKWYETTVVKYQATAGMRLLTEQQQAVVFDALYRGLMNSETFVFRQMQRNDISTLSGDLEGYYGAVAANYLSGLIDVNLHIIENNNNSEGMKDVANPHPIGALDMGGSSTQIVYLTEQIDNGSHSCSQAIQAGKTVESLEDKENESTSSESDDEEYPQTCRLSDYEGKTKLQGDNFFKTSYLSYGVDEFRERMWNTLIIESKMEDRSDSCDTKMIPYPCGFKGYQLEWASYTLIGTGDVNACAKQVQRLLPHPEHPMDNHHEHAGQTVGGIEHPKVRGKFFAMSLYFFTLDSLRVLSHPKADAHEALNSSWPRPSIDELTDALEGLCSRSWAGDLEDIQYQAHKFTRAEVLPHRCFESVYMVTLLRDGFGFHPQSRDITFTFLVDGSEVEWSLGMALTLFSEINSTESNTESSAECSVTEEDRNSTEWRERGANSDLPSSSFATLVTNSG